MKRARTLGCLCLLLLAAVSAPAPAIASETRSFVITWFNIAEYFDPERRDCPHGTNPGPDIFFRRELTRLGRPAAEIDSYINSFGNLAGGPGAAPVQMRGR